MDASFALGKYAWKSAPLVWDFQMPSLVQPVSVLCEYEVEVPESLVRDNKGFGHFIAIGMGVAAALVMFGIVWPAAKTMMSTTVTSMNTLNSQVLGSLSGLTLAATGSIITLTFPSGSTPSTTAADYTVTVNGGAATVSSVSAGGQVATITLSTAMNTGSSITVTYADGTSTYTGAGTAS